MIEDVVTPAATPEKDPVSQLLLRVALFALATLGGFAAIIALLLWARI